MITTEVVTDEGQRQQCMALRYEVLRKPWGQPRGSELDTDDTDSLLLAALDEGKVVGTARLLQLEDGVMQIRSMAVDPAVRGKKIGAMLLERAEQEAVKKGCRMIILHARENAVGFYEKQGFRVISASYVLFEVIPHFLMEKIPGQQVSQ